MSPEYQPSPDGMKFLKTLFKDVGNEVSGDTYRITLQSGDEHLVTVTETSIISSQSVIDAVQSFVKGQGVFRSEETSIIPYGGEITEDLTIKELFEDAGENRTRNALIRGGFDNAHEVAEILREGNEDKILAVLSIGEKSLQVLKVRLGI